MRRAWLSTAMLLIVTACSGGPVSGFPGEPDACQSLSTLDLGGQWVLRGEGKRRECTSHRLDAKFDLSVAPFYVATQAQAGATHASTAADTSDAADAFVDRIRKSPVALSAKLDVDGVTFQGAGGRPDPCSVRFTLCEPLPGVDLSGRSCDELPDGDALRYQFAGTMTDVDRVEGELTGTGPGPCRVEGTFTVEVQ